MAPCTRQTFHARTAGHLNCSPLDLARAWHVGAAGSRSTASIGLAALSAMTPSHIPDITDNGLPTFLDLDALDPDGLLCLRPVLLQLVHLRQETATGQPTICMQTPPLRGRARVAGSARGRNAPQRNLDAARSGGCTWHRSRRRRSAVGGSGLGNRMRPDLKNGVWSLLPGIADVAFRDFPGRHVIFAGTSPD